MQKNQLIFNPIATKYNFLNRLFSLNLDRSWRRILVYKTMKNLPQKKELNILDLGCGTGDVLKAFASFGSSSIKNAIGIDISEKMMEIFLKDIRYNSMNMLLAKADGIALPFHDNFFDIVASAFVIRNIYNIRSLFMEIKRVLRPKGIFSFLEFSIPKNLFQKNIFKNYLYLIKKIGDTVTSTRSYSHLSSSIIQFHNLNLKQILCDLGYKIVGFFYLVGGIVQLGVFKK
jgi:demethylmenaquinone methyltransferase / 2-methoxy-6-polyprenyl-1,4-benzoquinol methylase